VCNATKSLKSFASRKVRGVLYRRYICSACRTRRWRQRKPEIISLYNRQQRSKYKVKNPAVREVLYSHIGQHSCKLCGCSNKTVLGFHHRVADQREFTISVAIGKLTSLARLKVEAEKCDVLCANCHTLHHRFHANKKTTVRATKALKTKERLLRSLGINTCNRCGNPDSRVLCFHHLHDKEFSISSGIITNKSFETLLTEAGKCEVLCLNCHLEEHNG